MAEADRSLLDQALDVLLYAPVGLAVTASEELPSLVEKGRRRVEGELANARVVGRFAFGQGQRQAGRAVREGVRRLLAEAAATSGSVGEPAGGTVPATDAATRPAPRARPPMATAPSAPSPAPTPHPPGARAGRALAGADGEAGDLAIPGYDSLSASQVVQRLPGLTEAELAAVGAYEARHRRRRTILNRVTQLQGGAPG